MGFGMELIGFSGLLDLIQEFKDFAIVEGNGWIVGTNVEYSVYVEFGTSKMSAQPYLRPAVRETFNQKFDEFSDRADNTAELIKLLALEVESRAKNKAPVDTGRLMNSIEAERM